jgi:hypothetical protein
MDCFHTLKDSDADDGHQKETKRELVWFLKFLMLMLVLMLMITVLMTVFPRLPRKVHLDSRYYCYCKVESEGSVTPNYFVVLLYTFVSPLISPAC